MLSLKKQVKSVNKKFLSCAILLTVLGLLAVADASVPQAINAFGDKFYFLKQQVEWAALGIVLLVVFSNIKYTFWRRLAYPLFGISLVFLIMVLIPQFGLKTLGARRWIDLGFMNFQPSEVVKFTLALYFARLSESNKKALAYFLPVALIGLLIMLQPDLGTTLIVVSIGFTQMFVAGVNIWHFLAVILSGASASIALILTSDYRRARLMSFFEATQDPLGKSYHIRQVLLSLGLGGVFGVGLGASRQKYLFLPEASTDSIFAVIAEEVGFVGASILILILAYFIYLALKISFSAPDKFSKVFALGLTAWIGSQMLLNLASMLALVPLTGVPLPFFSYGGTSLMMILSVTGILLNISKYAEEPKSTKRKR
jgi:cell division protein FtsW